MMTKLEVFGVCQKWKQLTSEVCAIIYQGQGKQQQAGHVHD